MERWTWDQIGVVAECMAVYRSSVIESVLGPIAEGLGGKYEKGDPKRRAYRDKPSGKPRRTEIDFTDDAMVARAKARDARIVAAAQHYNLDLRL